MKVIIALLAFVVFVQAVLDMTSYREALDECKKKAGDDTEAKKCIDKCIVDKLLVINPEGELNVTAFSTDHQDSAKKCFDLHKDEEECARAKHFKQCLFNPSKTKRNIPQRLVNYCSQKTNTTIEGKFILNATILHEEFNDDTNACFVHCMGLGMVDNDGNFLIPLIIGATSTKNIDGEELAKNCSEKHNEKDVCLRGSKRYMCVIKSISRITKEREEDAE